MQTEVPGQRIPDEVADSEALVRSLHHSFHCNKKGIPNVNCLFARSGLISVTRLQYSSWDFCKQLALQIDEQAQLSGVKKSYRSMLLLCAGFLRSQEYKVFSHPEADNLAHAHLDFRAWANGSDELSKQDTRDCFDTLVERILKYPQTSSAGFFYIDQEPTAPSWSGPTEAEACQTCRPSTGPEPNL